MRRLFMIILALGGVVFSLTGCLEEKAQADLPALAENQKAAKSPAPVTSGAAVAHATAPAQPPAAAPVPMAGSAPTLTGTAEPHRRSTIAPKFGGTVEAVHVREGDRVQKGDRLVSLDTADMVLQKRQAAAAREAASAQYESAKVNWERTKSLLEQNGASPAQFDLADAQYKAAGAGLRLAEVAVDMAEKMLADCVIRAPYAGVITKRLINEGEAVTSMPPSMMLIIEEDVLLDLTVQVPEVFSRQVQPGTELAVHVPSLNKNLTAKITRIVAAVDSRTRSFTAIAEIENRNRELWPGMFAEVQLSPVKP